MTRSKKFHAMIWFSGLFWPCKSHMLCWRHLWQPFLGHSKSVCHTYRQLEGLSTLPGHHWSPTYAFEGKSDLHQWQVIGIRTYSCKYLFIFLIILFRTIWFRSWRYNSVFLPQERTSFPHLQADIGISYSMIWYWLLGTAYKLMYKYIIMFILTQIIIIYMYIYMHTL